MKLIVWLFLILSLLFFIPIPIKIKIYYSLNDYYINIYKFTVFSKKKLMQKEVKSKHFKKAPPKDNEKKRKQFMFKELKNILYKKILETLNKNKFKPYFSFTMQMEYSLNDASKTAIFYGIFNNFIYPFYKILCIPFNIKRYKVNITPKFEDNYLLKFESNSILFISFANIIYMMLIIFKYIQVSEEVAPNK